MLLFIHSIGIPGAIILESAKAKRLREKLCYRKIGRAITIYHIRRNKNKDFDRANIKFPSVFNFKQFDFYTTFDEQPKTLKSLNILYEILI